MAFILDSTELPRPTHIRERIIETKKENTTIEGKLVVDIVNQKRQYTLDWEFLTTAQKDTIVEKIEKKEVLVLTVSDGDVVIGSTNVHAVIKSDITYENGYRPALVLVLTEEQ